MNDHPTPDVPLEPSAIDIARRVAERLGDGTTWTASIREAFDDHGQRYAELTRTSNGAQLGVSVGGYRSEGRVTFRAHWPKYRDGQGYTPREYFSITCSTGRDPKTLAREIERRLLANYEPAYRDALAEIQASDSASASGWIAAERIARIVGADLPAAHNRPKNGASVHLHLRSSHVYGLKVQPPHADRPVLVSFDVHDVDEATALEMLALLARRQPDA